MLEPEYRIGFRILMQELGVFQTLRVAVPAFIRSFGVRYAVDEDAEEAERTKAGIKNHFKLLAQLYLVLKARYGGARADAVIQRVMMEGGRVFFRGFTPFGPNEGLREFVEIYTDFERRKIVFDVVEDTGTRFEIVINRCLVFESFDELGIAELSRWMCDIAFEYFNGYHPRLTYEKDRMIARGDSTCHEVFTWQ